MRERISRLARGEELKEELRLTVEPGEVCLDLAAGQNYRGELTLREAEGNRVKSLLYSSNYRVHLFADQFVGSRGTVAYEVNVQGLRPGEHIEGQFFLVSDGGERRIPYAFTVTAPAGRTAYERIRTIEAFADLARQDFDVALKIFENSGFLTLPFMDQPSFAALYRGLYGKGDRREALEEFLTGCGAKEQLRLSVDEGERPAAGLEKDQADVIEIERNTWGAVNIRVRTDAPFIELETRLLTEDSFEENRCSLHYTLHPSMLHAGVNRGRIILSTPYQSFTVEVTASRKGRTAQEHRQGEYRAEVLRFFAHYVDALGQDFQNRVQVNGMLTEIARLRDSYDTPDMLELLHAQICILAGQRDRAGLLLADVKERVLARRLEDIDAYCCYLYVRSLYTEDEEDREQLSRILHLYYEGEHPSQTVFFLLIRTDMEYRDNPLQAREEMRALYERGCRSPFLYLEACRLYESQPLLLAALGEFELHALAWGGKKGMIGRELALRIAALSENERTFRPAYYRLLTRLAECYENVEIVEAICRVLILGEKKGEAYFSWFEMGVAFDVRLTRLYEYYLYSLPAQWKGPLPQEIYLYFSYTNTLDDVSRAALYDNILSCFSPEDATYASYERQMEDFARDQALSGHMSEKLARIYERMLPAGVVDEKLAAALPRLLYSVQISCDNRSWDRVIVCCEEMEGEITARLTDGQAVVPVYSEHCRILFQDSFGSRLAGASYLSRRLFGGEELEEKLFALCPEDEFLAIRRCRKALDDGRIDEEALSFYEQVLSIQGLREQFARRLTSRLIEGSLRDGHGERLLRLDTSYASPEDIRTMTEVFIRDDFCDRAFSLIRRYGYEDLSPSLLLKLCSRMCVEQLFAPDPFLLEACYCCMNKRRNDAVILEYLCRHYNSSSERMYQVLRRAARYRAPLYDLPERLLGQMLFTGSRQGIDDVFEAYESQGQLDETLLRAYLAVKCYDFFTADVAASRTVFDLVEERLKKDSLPFVCRLALCRYLSLTGERSAGENELCMEVIRRCCDQDMFFDFFGAFAGEPGYPAYLKGRQIVSCRGREGERLRIRCRTLPDGRFAEEVLPHVWGGWYSRCFTLFYGEQMDYEILRALPQGEVTIRKGSLRVQEDEDGAAADTYGNGYGKDRLSRLNQIIRGLDVLEEGALKREMRDYAVAETVINRYFTKL